MKMNKTVNIFSITCMLLLVLHPATSMNQIRLTLDGTGHEEGRWTILTKSIASEDFQMHATDYPAGGVVEEVITYEESDFTTSELFFMTDPEGRGWVESFPLFVSGVNPGAGELLVEARQEELWVDETLLSPSSLALREYYERYHELLRQLWNNEVQFQSASEIEAYLAGLMQEVTSSHQPDNQLKNYLELASVVNYMELCRRSGIDFSEGSHSGQELLEKFDSPYFHFFNESRMSLGRIISSLTPGAATPLQQLEQRIDLLQQQLETTAVQRAMADFYFSSFISGYSSRSPQVFNNDLKTLTRITQKLQDPQMASQWLEQFSTIRYTFEGSQVPDITFLDLEGNQLKFSDIFDGKNYVYIDLWATWCLPCIKEFPFLAELEQKYEQDNIRFVGISVDATQDIWINRGVKRYDLSGDQYFDQDAKVLKDLQIQAIPRFLFYDPQGNWISLDAPRPSDPRLVELIDSHLHKN